MAAAEQLLLAPREGVVVERGVSGRSTTIEGQSVVHRSGSEDSNMMPYCHRHEGLAG